MDKSALFNFSYGVYVVSSIDDNKNVGCVINSVFQVSATPATLAISINKNNYTNPCILKSKKFVISILTENSNQTVIGTFGFKSSKDTNKFENVKFITTESGVPVLTTDTCAYVECKVINSVDCFTHTVVLAEIVDAKVLTNESPMTYAYYHKVIKGKAPKNAPTYIDDTKTNETKYICSVCGYEYADNHDEFNSLPDSYRCPICTAPKSAFELK